MRALVPSPPWLTASLIALLVLVPGCKRTPSASTEHQSLRPVPKGPLLVDIPSGVFMMGADNAHPVERPMHRVAVAAFQMDQTEVTVAQYAECVAARACPPAGSSPYDPINTEARKKAGGPFDVNFFGQFCNGDRNDRADHPINCVDWKSADSYCRWAGKRLPTEEEWEYAARGTDGRIYPWGEAPPAADLLNACGSECAHAFTILRGDSGANGTPHEQMYEGDDGFAQTSPVGSYSKGRSPFGLFDMAGNVSEWVAGPYCEYPDEGATTCVDTRVQSEAPHVHRGGGGWEETRAVFARSSWRLPGLENFRLETTGFRCAR